MNIQEIIKNPEGRKLEFKEKFPTKSDLCKTAIAFANDAGGVIYIGVKDEPREVIGLDEIEIIKLEEKISSIIHDNCVPAILPDISIVNYDKKSLLKVMIHIGGKSPYYLKSKGKYEGTYIRVGSSNRIASKEIIDELERKAGNISYDSEISLHKSVDSLDISSFKDLYKEKAKETLTANVLDKLELIKAEQGAKFPVNALILLSDDKIRRSKFPYAN